MQYQGKINRSKEREIFGIMLYQIYGASYGVTYFEVLLYYLFIFQCLFFSFMCLHITQNFLFIPSKVKKKIKFSCIVYKYFIQYN